MAFFLLSRPELGPDPGSVCRRRDRHGHLPDRQAPTPRIRNRAD